MDFQEWKLLNSSVQEQEQEQDDETLSLCDLALNNTNIISSIVSNNSEEDQRSSSSFDDDQDIFEFFRSDFSATISTYNPKDNIIFCGKMIPYKGEKNNRKEEEEEEEEEAAARNSINSVGKWWQYSYSCRSTSVQEAKAKEEERPRRRSRWYLFAFGLGRYRGDNKMELKDIKTRQSKMISDGKMRRSLRYYDHEMEESEIGSGKSEKKWWSLVRILGCQSSHANSMVKASLGLMPT